MAYKVGTTGVNALAWVKLRVRALMSFRGGRLKGLPGHGSTLDETTRSEMESLLGYDLKGVRIHETRLAGELARGLGAEAFTIGSDIFAAQGKLHTATSEGKALLAHEVTHAIQQTQPGPMSSRPDESSTGGAQSFSEGNSSLVGDRLRKESALTLQLSPVGQFRIWENPGAEALETAARGVEQIVRQGIAGVAKAPVTDVDPEEIAHMVYRLMQQELLLEKDRFRR